MKRRPRRTIPATLTALVLLAACVLTAIVAIQSIIGRRPLVSYRSVTDALNGLHWNDTAVLAAGAAAVLLGFVLLLAAFLPGKPTVLPLTGDVDAGVTRRSLRRALQNTAASVDGVSRAKLKLGRRTITARIRTDRTNTAGLTRAVRGALDQRLDEVTPLTRPATKIKLHATRNAP
ncbi:DUF6286 domain-containing protein [Streptomyces sp. NBC_01619]|uniref:DUF6286 domain-containing protein n=1 Tax=Streptomyces pratisoli TaxID=3139917 RepID=A0ACC6QTB7_9ACTN|nr:MULTISPECIES: DUF6286 domain-containing protein [unclassified Streptomyces]MCX4513682.1 DUF6286 domain-containing protein [Streptomyces sp. NBC_01619]